MSGSGGGRQEKDQHTRWHLARRPTSRRLRLHGLIARIPHSHRYQVTDAGLHHALFLTRVHDRLIRTGTAQLTDPDPPTRSPLRSAAHAYHTALDQIAKQAGLAA
jgi:hypothetical protein